MNAKELTDLCIRAGVVVIDQKKLRAIRNRTGNKMYSKQTISYIVKKGTNDEKLIKELKFMAAEKEGRAQRVFLRSTSAVSFGQPVVMNPDGTFSPVVEALARERKDAE